MSAVMRTAEACYGCRTCELVCSFHPRRASSPEWSSINVFHDNRTGKIDWVIDGTCDLCVEEKGPFCVRHCS